MSFGANRAWSILSIREKNSKDPGKRRKDEDHERISSSSNIHHIQKPSNNVHKTHASRIKLFRRRHNNGRHKTSTSRGFTSRIKSQSSDESSLSSSDSSSFQDLTLLEAIASNGAATLSLNGKGTSGRTITTNNSSGGIFTRRQHVRFSSQAPEIIPCTRQIIEEDLPQLWYSDQDLKVFKHERVFVLNEIIRTCGKQVTRILDETLEACLDAQFHPRVTGSWSSSPLPLTGSSSEQALIDLYSKYSDLLVGMEGVCTRNMAQDKSYRRERMLRLLINLQLQHQKKDSLLSQRISLIRRQEGSGKQRPHANKSPQQHNACTLQLPTILASCCERLSMPSQMLARKLATAATMGEA